MERAARKPKVSSTIALYESGGVASKVHTEDIAIKAHEMFPDSFSWTKYPDRVDKDIVRVALVEAARKLNGAMVEGRSGRGRGHTKGKSQPRGDRRLEADRNGHCLRQREHRGNSQHSSEVGSEVS